MNPFDIIAEEFPKWWADDTTKDLRDGLTATKDALTIPYKAVAIAADVGTAISVYDKASSGDYAGAMIEAIGFIGGKQTSKLAKEMFKAAGKPVSDQMKRGMETYAGNVFQAAAEANDYNKKYKEGDGSGACGCN